MGKLFVIGMIFPLFFLISCGEEESSAEGLTIVMPEKAFILPGSGNSCAAINSAGDNAFFDDIPEFRVAISNIQVTWNRTAQDLILLYFKIEIDHPLLGEYTTTVDGIELDLLLGTITGSAGSAEFATTTASPTDKVVTPVEMDSTKTSFLNGASKTPCSLSFGSIQVPDDAGKFTANVKITLVALARGNGKTLDSGTIAPGEVPLTVFDEEALKLEQTVKLIFDF